jgi:predicted ABC-class ATPase
MKEVKVDSISVVPDMGWSRLLVALSDRTFHSIRIHRGKTSIAEFRRELQRVCQEMEEKYAGTE